MMKTFFLFLILALTMFANGTGVNQNLIYSFPWLTLSASQGDSDAYKGLKNSYRLDDSRPNNRSSRNDFGLFFK